MFRSFIEQLESRLNKELPGEAAQFSMAPIARKKRSEISFAEISPKKSAVMIVLYPHDETIHAVLIQRGTYEGVHSGQVAFPGGKFEDGDLDLKQTALRETNEEIGLLPQQIKVLGSLTEVYITPSNFLVKPFVGVVHQKPDFIVDAREVARVITVDLFQLNNKEIIKEKSILQSGGFKIKTPYYEIEGLTIWGATAMMISELNAVVAELKFTSSSQSPS